MWRPLAVWCGVTTAATLAAGAVPGAWHAFHVDAPSEQVADLLVAVCATGLAAGLAWLWAITTATVAGVVTGRRRTGGGATRRLVLLACGAAVVAGTSVPAMAAGGDGAELLVGLTLPERAVVPAHHRPTDSPPTSHDYVVRRGDSLWSIARAHADPPTSTDQRWQAIWRANREVIGHDPDLIHPGQALRLPEPHDTDGDQ